MRGTLAALLASVVLLGGCGGDSATTASTSAEQANEASAVAAGAEGLPEGVVALLGDEAEEVTFFGCEQVIRSRGPDRVTRCNVKFGDRTRIFIHGGQGWVEE